MSEKRFDCVQRKREGGRAIYQRINRMTGEQKVAYWKSRTDQFERLIRAAERRMKESQAAEADKANP